MLQKFICGLKLNKVTPTKGPDNIKVPDDTTNIDNISFTFICEPKLQKRIINNYKVQQKTIKRNTNKGKKRTTKNYKSKKWAFLLKFINCLKC
jgi:hypothetical protein